MTHTDTKFTDDELMAFVDGQASPENAALIAAYLAENAQAAARVAEWQQQSDALKALFDHVEQETIPARLNPRRIEQEIARPRFSVARYAMAASLILSLGIAAGWIGRDLSTPQISAEQTLITAAFDAHTLFSSQEQHPVEVASDDAFHLTAWLSTTLDRRLVAPNLDDLGFSLVGGRILPAGDSNAAQIMYQADTGKRVTLYLTPRQPGDTGDNVFSEQGQLASLYWANDAVTCTIVGELTRAEMEAVASSVFSALSWRQENYTL